MQRKIESEVAHSLAQFPVVGLVGPRQSGKTTLAKHIAKTSAKNSLYLDLEKPSDLAKLDDAELYFGRHADKLIILDEVQRRPDLFPLLRAVVDTGRKKGRFLLLGSAAPDLTRQASESLAGRIVYHELSPFSLGEIKATAANLQRLWLRGGFPLSYLAQQDRDSFRWREAFIQTYLERDIPQLGLRVPAAALRRFWTMIAHSHGQLWNGAKIAAGLGVSNPTVRHYLDILQDTFIVRQLPPYHANTKKRLVKSPRVYVRDSGILHALLHLPGMDDLLGHPIVGGSWEGWVIEQLLAIMPSTWQASFYRTSAGAEIDLVLERANQRIAIEVKHSLDPRPSKGFWLALADLGDVQAYVIYPGKERYPLAPNVEVLPAAQLGLVRALHGGAS